MQIYNYIPQTFPFVAELEKYLKAFPTACVHLAAIFFDHVTIMWHIASVQSY